MNRPSMPVRQMSGGPFISGGTFTGNTATGNVGGGGINVGK